MTHRNILLDSCWVFRKSSPHSHRKIDGSLSSIYFADFTQRLITNEWCYSSYVNSLKTFASNKLNLVSQDRFYFKRHVVFYRDFHKWTLLTSILASCGRILNQERKALYHWLFSGRNAASTQVWRLWAVIR